MNTRPHRGALAVFLLAVLSTSALAEEPTHYDFFHPVPKALLRQLQTDRPDTTESPYTVDAGHFQIEASTFDYSRERTAGERTERWIWGSFNLKAGLEPNMDLQLIFDSYTEERTQAGGVTTQRSGFSDLTLRLKTNLWGDDGGNTAFAIMPYLKVPTGTQLSNGRVEGGLILPFSATLAKWLTMGSMIEADAVYDEEARRHIVQFLHSITFGIALAEHLSMFVEYAGTAGEARNFDYQATFNTGAVVALTDEITLDAGVRIGLTDAGEDLGVFSGFSIRF